MVKNRTLIDYTNRTQQSRQYRLAAETDDRVGWTNNWYFIERIDESKHYNHEYINSCLISFFSN